MNSGLWLSGLTSSRLGLAALVTAVAFVVWHLLGGQPLGSRDDDNAAFLLWSGWLAVLLFVALALYAVRRAAHRLRLSPEFAWKAKLANLERAQSELTELQNCIARREVVGAPSAHKAATRILRRFGVHRVLAVTIEPDTTALGLLRVHTTPREPLGRLAAWLSAHVWLGLAAAVLVCCHGGLRTTSTMGLLLNVLSLAVIGSGVVGALLWTFGPTWLTRAEREMSIEKAWALREYYGRKVTEAATALQGATATGTASTLRRDLAILTGQRDLVERELRRLSLFRSLLRGWRLLHVPCSVLLLALVGVHILGVWRY